MSAPLPFTNREADEAADWIDDIASRSQDDNGTLQRVTLKMSLEVAQKLAATLRWMTTNDK